MKKFCLMNPSEKICTGRYSKCFDSEIPSRFDYDGRINQFCSIIFPPGYSVHIQKFQLDRPDQDNFVLLDRNPVQYHSEVKWENRFQKFWKNLPVENPLRKKAVRRENIQCVQSMTVKSLTFTLTGSDTTYACGWSLWRLSRFSLPYSNLNCPWISLNRTFLLQR